MLVSGQIGLLIALRVPPEMGEALQACAVEVGVSRSEVVRRAITSYLSGSVTCTLLMASGAVASGAVSVLVNRNMA